MFTFTIYSDLILNRFVQFPVSWILYLSFKNESTERPAFLRRDTCPPVFFINNALPFSVLVRNHGLFINKRLTMNVKLVKLLYKLLGRCSKPEKAAMQKAESRFDTLVARSKSLYVHLYATKLLGQPGYFIILQ